MTHYPGRAENKAKVSPQGGEDGWWVGGGGVGGWQVAERRLWYSRRHAVGSAGEVQSAVRGSIAGGADTTRPRDDGRDEGWKRKLTRSEPDTEGIYYNLKWE